MRGECYEFKKAIKFNMCIDTDLQSTTADYSIRAKQAR